ncbi:MAG: hypothetical protein ACRDD8_06240 [Bacteroidales bacterium]
MLNWIRKSISLLTTPLIHDSPDLTLIDVVVVNKIKWGALFNKNTGKYNLRNNSTGKLSGNYNTLRGAKRAIKHESRKTR